jgi:predicted ABC-type ATPase
VKPRVSKGGGDIPEAGICRHRVHCCLNLIRFEVYARPAGLRGGLNALADS